MSSNQNLKNKFLILIVDDEVDIAEMLSDEFIDKGHVTQTAGGGHEALEILSSQKFDAIVSDVRMPSGDGVFLFKKVMTFPEADRPLFFFITGQADITKEDALSLGAKDFFHKPFDMEQLIERVLSCLQERAH